MTKPDIIVNTVFSIVALSGWAVVFMMEPEPRIVEVEVEAEPVVIEKPTTVFLVDGVTCWVGNYPTLVYDPTDFTVKLEITCKDDVVWHYLPAIERTQ